MARACLCDRCGKLFTPKRSDKYPYNRKPVTGITLMLLYSEPYKDFDLCEECISELYKFLNVKEEDIWSQF